ncbi:MAG: hypothetical protein RBU27_13745 [Bacteroidota bacterium]|jgi:hypothetical protein|nr:hypothetical protein [Bacteroidota bacterium]
MKQILTLALAALILTACGKTEESNDTDANIQTVSQLLESPEQYIDKEITLEGTVTHVCKHGGRRLHLTDLEPNVKIRIEAPEDMPAFARELEGSDIVVTAILRETRIDKAYLDEWEAEVREGMERENHDHATPTATGEGEENEGHVEPQGLEAVNAKRAELEASGKPYLSQWYADGVRYQMKDGSSVPVAKETPADGEE